MKVMVISGSPTISAFLDVLTVAELGADFYLAGYELSYFTV